MRLDKYIATEKEHGTYDTVDLEVVDATKLRLKDISFTMGGHYYAYPDLIAEDKIFLDDRMDKDNIVATSIHEFVERTFMKFYGIKYEDAHSLLANPVEKVVREFMDKVLPDLDKDFIKGRD